MDLTKSEYQYKIGFSCICNVIRRFACFSSTLNCLIVKKGSSTCAGTDIFAYVTQVWLFDYIFDKKWIIMNNLLVNNIKWR
jgi:hypothetical protein